MRRIPKSTATLCPGWFISRVWRSDQAMHEWLSWWFSAQTEPPTVSIMGFYWAHRLYHPSCMTVSSVWACYGYNEGTVHGPHHSSIWLCSRKARTKLLWFEQRYLASCLHVYAINGPPFPLLFSFFPLFSLSLKAFRVFCRVHCFIGKALIVLFNVTKESEGSFIPRRSLSLHVLSVSQLLFFQIPGVLLVLFSFASSHELLLTAH